MGNGTEQLPSPRAFQPLVLGLQFLFVATPARLVFLPFLTCTAHQV